MIPQQIQVLIDELDGLAPQRSDALQVPRVEGQVLYHIAVATGAKRIIEVGTSYGYSGLYWGAALRRCHGSLHTIDVETRKRDSAQATFLRAGLSDIVTCHLGDARTVLPTIAGPFDLAFLDADKESTLDYFELIWPKLSIGGSVLTDNATTHHAELAQFVRAVRARHDGVSIQVAVGNGLEWTVKLA